MCELKKSHKDALFERKPGAVLAPLPSRGNDSPFSDPFDDMSYEEKSKLILMLQDMLDQTRREAEAKEREMKELLGRLDAVLEGQLSSKKQIDELTETIRKLNATIRKLTKELEEKDKLIADLQNKLSRRNSDLYGSKSQNSKPPN